LIGSKGYTLLVLSLLSTNRYSYLQYILPIFNSLLSLLDLIPINPIYNNRFYPGRIIGIIYNRYSILLI
jgi:hypothetical protein